MPCIIGPDNVVRYGVYDEPVEFNHKDFILLDFFGKPLGAIRKKLAFHAFNYLGIYAPGFMVGLAAVHLGYMNAVFAYLYDYEKGMMFEFDTKAPFNMGMDFPANPDEYVVDFSRGATRLSIIKSLSRKRLRLLAQFKGRLNISMDARYSLESHQPLRVLNPSEPYRFTFTEKCAPIIPEKVKIVLDGQDMDCPAGRTCVLYDWSGGYLRRETNWYWASMAAVLPDEAKTSIGANFAALTNESYFSENAFWINHQRTRVSRAIFQFIPKDPYKPWRIFDEAGSVDLVFTPKAERSEKINAVLLKTWLRQFFGTFSGTLSPAGQKPVSFKDVQGITELHRALW